MFFALVYSNLVSQWYQQRKVCVMLVYLMKVNAIIEEHVTVFCFCKDNEISKERLLEESVKRDFWMNVICWQLKYIVHYITHGVLPEATYNHRCWSHLRPSLRAHTVMTSNQTPTFCIHHIYHTSHTLLISCSRRHEDVNSLSNKVEL